MQPFLVLVVLFMLERFGLGADYVLATGGLSVCALEFESHICLFKC